MKDAHPVLQSTTSILFAALHLQHFTMHKGLLVLFLAFICISCAKSGALSFEDRLEEADILSWAENSLALANEEREPQKELAEEDGSNESALEEQTSREERGSKIILNKTCMITRKDKINHKFRVPEFECRDYNRIATILDLKHDRNVCFVQLSECVQEYRTYHLNNKEYPLKAGCRIRT